jgi:CRISPR-associated protein (TIGR02584 family)
LKNPKNKIERGTNTRTDREVVLVTTVGTSPSVLTSTVWALAHDQNIVPHRIKILTSTVGRDRLLQQVFSPAKELGGKTAWDDLCRSLQQDGFDITGRLVISPGPPDIRVFTAVQPGQNLARELSDIGSQTESEQVADAMLETLRSVMNDDTQVIASIAGGRKTVSALFYACVSLIGRSEDRIIHVVVNEPFTRSDLTPPFFFPSQENKLLIYDKNSRVSSEQAVVTVIDVPFVPLSNLFIKELGKTPGRFSALIAKYRAVGRKHRLESLQLIVHRCRQEIEIDQITINLGPREQLLLVFLAEHVHKGGPAFPSIKKLAAELEVWRSKFIADRPPKNLSDWRNNLDGGALDETDVQRSFSSLRKKLLEAEKPAPELIAALPQRGHFTLALSKKQIRLVD